MTLRFGTDGVRGLANADLTPEYALAFGRVAARVLGGAEVVIGRDTRRSGPLLEGALSAGFAAEGVSVRLLGVAPTPAVAWLSAREHVPGVVISASHNAFADNGLKAFAPGGLKLSDNQQEAFEAELHLLLAGDGDGAGSGARAAVTGAAVGAVRHDPVAVDRYGDAVAASLAGRRLEGVDVVVDTANGAASVIGPAVLRSLGASVTAIATTPNGTNINAGCGSTHLEGLQRAVVEQGAQLGFAFDGDADRVLAVDAQGVEIDGDQLIAMCAIDRHARGCLPGDTVVVTVMTNLGFRLGMAARGIEVHETAVGDRYVLEALERGAWTLGGEQSGHVIFRDLATTGDGLLTAVQVLDLVVRSGQTVRELADAAMTRLPQVLRNVTVTGRAADVVAAIDDHIRAVSARLGDRGRVLVRPSGTEPLVRVMAEAAELRAAEAAVAELVAAAERAVATA